MEFNVGVRVKVKVEWRSKQKLSRSSEYQSCQRWSRLIKVIKVGSSWSRLIFELRKYNLNYLFEYWKSVAKSGSIVNVIKLRLELSCGDVGVNYLANSHKSVSG